MEQQSQERLPNNETPRYKAEVGLQGRLLLLTNAGKENPSVLDVNNKLGGVEKEDLGTGNRNYSVLNNASNNERSMENGVDPDKLEEVINVWCDGMSRVWKQDLTKNKKLNLNAESATRWQKTLAKLTGVTNVNDLNQQNVRAVYDKYFKGEDKTTNIDLFIKDVVQIYSKPDRSVDIKALKENYDCIQWFAKIFGTNSAEIVTQMLDAQVRVHTDSDNLITELNAKETNNIQRIDNLNEHEKQLLNFLNASQHVAITQQTRTDETQHADDEPKTDEEQKKQEYFLFKKQTLLQIKQAIQFVREKTITEDEFQKRYNMSSNDINGREEQVAKDFYILVQANTEPLTHEEEAEFKANQAHEIEEQKKEPNNKVLIEKVDLELNKPQTQEVFVKIQRRAIENNNKPADQQESEDKIIEDEFKKAGINVSYADFSLYRTAMNVAYRRAIAPIIERKQSAIRAQVEKWELEAKGQTPPQTETKTDEVQLKTTYFDSKRATIQNLNEDLDKVENKRMTPNEFEIKWKNTVEEARAKTDDIVEGEAFIQTLRSIHRKIYAEEVNKHSNKDNIIKISNATNNPNLIKIVNNRFSVENLQGKSEIEKQAILGGIWSEELVKAGVITGRDQYITYIGNREVISTIVFEKIEIEKKNLGILIEKWEAEAQTPIRIQVPHPAHSQTLTETFPTEKPIEIKTWTEILDLVKQQAEQGKTEIHLQTDGNGLKSIIDQYIHTHKPKNIDIKDRGSSESKIVEHQDEPEANTRLNLRAEQMGGLRKEDFEIFYKFKNHGDKEVHTDNYTGPTKPILGQPVADSLNALHLNDDIAKMIGAQLFDQKSKVTITGPAELHLTDDGKLDIVLKFEKKP